MRKVRHKKREKELRKNPEWVEKEKARAREKYHRLEYKDKHKPSKEHKKRIMDRYKLKYPEKYFAHNKCQKIKPIVKGNHLHHWSYNEEHCTDVIELTPKEHYIVHRWTIYDQERMMYRVASTFSNWQKGCLLDTKERATNFYKELLFKANS